MAGSITAEVYRCIRDEDYSRAIQLLEAKLGKFSRSRQLLSLLAYCCYQNQEYARAAEFYETLTELFPEEEYHVYYVQSLVKGGSYLDACRVAASAVLTSETHSQRMRMLQAYAELEQGMLSPCSTTLSQCTEDDPETIIALATLDFKEGRHAKALETYKIAKQVIGKRPMLAYYIALCYYELSDYDAVIGIADEIIEEEKEHDVPANLHDHPNNETFLVEALNLKAAALYASKKIREAKATLSRFKENLDTVTIHNDVLVNIEDDPILGMQRLEFVLNQSFPKEALSNLLTLYTIHGQDELAAETFEKNKHLAKELFLPDVYAYFDAAILSLTCPDEALSKLEHKTTSHAPKLRLTKEKISDAINKKPISHMAERKLHQALDAAKKEFEASLDHYIPALMMQARIHWDKKDYPAAERLLQKSASFLHDNPIFRMNLGHVVFAQQNDQFEAAIDHYEALLKHHAQSDLLKVPAVALANLCVAYVMTNQNEAAERMIKTVEKEEEHQLALGNSVDRTHHTCIINLVIGTLYCERRNYEFGISRICKSMEPFEKNLCPTTWFYTKRCFLALASRIAKLMCVIKEDTIRDILCFFDAAGRNGNDIVTDGETCSNPLSPGDPTTIASEAGELKNIFIKLCA
ncbi:hypothetical protein ACHAWF_011319 [Thalassiosira exigua]